MSVTTGTPAPPGIGGPDLDTTVDDPRHARRWWVLVVVSVAQLMVVLDATIVNIALPSAQADLGFTDGNRQWVVTAYALAFGSLLLLGGRLADLFGRKIVFLVGLGGFALASVLGGFAGNFDMLVVARTLQGLFGALLAPAALSLLTTTFTDPEERGKAFGIFGAVVGAGAAVGLLLGGLLTEYLSWRWCMFVNVAFVAFTFSAGMIFLVRDKLENRPKIDIPGTVVVSAALFSVVYGFANAASHGWSNPLTWGFLAGGAVGLVVFVWLQRLVEHPLLPLRVVLDRNRGGAFVAVFLQGAGMFGVFLFLTYYLQASLGYSPVSSGLAFLPLVGGLMVAAAMATATLLPRFGPRLLITLGMVLSAGGMLWLTTISLESTYVANVLPEMIVLGVGMGLVVAPAMNIATLGVDASDSGVASAMVNTQQQVGGSIGTALLSTLAATAATNYLADREPTPAGIAQSMIESYVTAFWWSAGIFALGAVVCGLLLRPGVPEFSADAEPALVH